MLKKTKGIVIGYVKYRETSIIVHVFTREMGMKSYIVNGARSAKATQKMALYQPLTLLELVVYDKENRNIHRISEAQLEMAFTRIPFDFHRTTTALFVVEALRRSIPEHYQNDQLFDFLHRSIRLLDHEKAHLALFPLRFLIEMTEYLGFKPEHASEFYEQLPINKSSAGHVHKHELLAALLKNGEQVVKPFPSAVKRELMDDLLVFYRLHLENFGEIKSLPVLRNLM
ncbi:DNA recombination and repair protein RecO [Lunatimonas lonarensis]|uniref:DNA repair protein RecO n=1 Tax=Lunatimonas lonarensis TaxID=1232681 RepID=R7ZLK6_9BACT|nr:DNA repair protein RecO [Lunatimonas lonarensis]EON74981.1 DNA recombination and repair protein RecO [Lunatimonas lonarensis]